MRGHLAGLLVPLALLGAAVTASAQERPASTVVQTNEAVTAHMRRGRLAREAGRWSEAESAFRDALSAADPTLLPPVVRAEILGEIGYCELARRSYRDAAEHFAESLVERAALHPALRARFEDGRREAEKQVFRAYVAVSPPDAQLLVNGKPVTQKAGSHVIFLNPGRYIFRARMVGLGDAFQTLDATAGDHRDISLTLDRSSSEVRVISRPPTPQPQPPSADAGESVGSKLRIAGIVLAASTGLAGVTALVWAATSDGELADIRKRKDWERYTCSAPDPPEDCKEIHRLAEQRVTAAKIGLASLAASGAIGFVTAASFALTAPSPPSRGGARVGVVLGQQNGLVIHGVW